MKDEEAGKIMSTLKNHIIYIVILFLYGI